MSGAITDVAGLRVGHAQRTGDGWLTGVTVVLPPAGTVGAVDVRGGAPATHETDALGPHRLVPTVDAVVLTGGSAYGLAAIAGVQAWCEEQGRGFPVDGGVVPIVPGAALFDLGRGGDLSARPDAQMGREAAEAAGTEHPGHAVARGPVGAGTGARCDQRRRPGGIGTASVQASAGDVTWTVGALAAVNAFGAPVDDGRYGVVALDPHPLAQEAATGANTTLVVLATDAALDPARLQAVASASHAGLARALDPAHALVDGDVVFGLATGAVPLPADPGAAVMALLRLQSAAAEAVRLACLDGPASAAG